MEHPYWKQDCSTLGKTPPFKSDRLGRRRWEGRFRYKRLTERFWKSERLLEAGGGDAELRLPPPGRGRGRGRAGGTPSAAGAPPPPPPRLRAGEPGASLRCAERGRPRLCWSAGSSAAPWAAPAAGRAAGPACGQLWGCRRGRGRRVPAGCAGRVRSRGRGLRRRAGPGPV